MKKKFVIVGLLLAAVVGFFLSPLSDHLAKWPEVRARIFKKADSEMEVLKDVSQGEVVSYSFDNYDDLKNLEHPHASPRGIEQSGVKQVFMVVEVQKNSHTKELGYVVAVQGEEIFVPAQDGVIPDKSTKRISISQSGRAIPFVGVPASSPPPKKPFIRSATPSPSKSKRQKVAFSDGGGFTVPSDPLENF